jgi:Zn-dependent protease
MIDIQNLIIVLVVVLFSMTLHEVMHGFVSNWLGDDTARLSGRLTLNPIKHIDPFLTLLLPLILAVAGGPIFGGAKPVPFNPARIKYDEWGVALVALSGPLVNLSIAFVLFASYALSGTPSGLVGEILRMGIFVNLGFFVFNMIPIPPLDGSRVLYAIAPEFVRRGMEAVEQFGIILIFAIVFLGQGVIGTFMLSSINAIVAVFSAIFGIA